MSAPPPFRFVATARRVREDRRFVVGRGNFVADVKLPGMLHVALVASQHAAARIVSIDPSGALAMPGVQYPHCNPWVSQNASCTMLSSPGAGATASMVVIA